MWVAGYVWYYEYVRVCTSMCVGMCVRYLELFRELRHGAQQMAYQNVTNEVPNILRMRSMYLVLSPILLGRFGSNLLFGTSCYVSDTQPPSDACYACTY